MVSTVELAWHEFVEVSEWDGRGPGASASIRHCRGNHSRDVRDGAEKLAGRLTQHLLPC